MTSAFTTGLRSRRALKPAAAAKAALVAAILVIFVAAPEAQEPATLLAGGPAHAGPASSLAAPTGIDLLVGRSTVVNVASPIARVSLTVPDVADAMVTGPSQLLIHGKQPGTISLFVWDRAGAITTYEVNVRRDLTALVAHLKQLFPGEPIEVRGSGKDVIVSGTVSSKYVIDKAADVAAGYVEKKENVVNLLRQQEGIASNQVMLKVRFAEVSRSALQELGAALFTGPGGFHDYVARTTTQQFPAPNFTELNRNSIQGPDHWGGGRDTVDSTGGKQTFGDFLNLFLFNNRYNVGTVIKALSERGLFQSLAEPNLISTNGKEASFLAGGEFPYPVVQGSSSGQTVTIQFKEFGIRLNFTPTVLDGDLINLKVRPEVSSLDFGNAVTVEGFRVPALSTRRTETEVELQNGQTFAIAGLLSNSVQDSMRKIPGIGDIPILGWLFKSKGIQKQQTELVVMITPMIVKRGHHGVSEGLPSLVEPYLGPPNKRLPNPEPYIGSPRYPANNPAPRPGTGADNAPAASPAPAQPQPQPESVAQRPNAEPPAAAVPSAPVAQTAAPAVPPAQEQKPTPTLTKEQRKALERAREEERKAAEKQAEEERKAAEQARKAQAAAEKARLEQEKREAEARKAAERAEAKRRAEQAKKDAELAKKEEELRRQAAKLEQERRKREAEVAKRNAEAARREGEEEQRRQKTLEEAAEKLKAAQAAYEAELAKSSASKNGGQ